MTIEALDIVDGTTGGVVDAGLIMSAVAVLLTELRPLSGVAVLEALTLLTMTLELYRDVLLSISRADSVSSFDPDRFVFTFVFDPFLRPVPRTSPATLFPRPLFLRGFASPCFLLGLELVPFILFWLLAGDCEHLEIRFPVRILVPPSLTLGRLCTYEVGSGALGFSNFALKLSIDGVRFSEELFFVFLGRFIHAVPSTGGSRPVSRCMTLIRSVPDNEILKARETSQANGHIDKERETPLAVEVSLRLIDAYIKRSLYGFSFFFPP